MSKGTEGVKPKAGGLKGGDDKVYGTQSNWKMMGEGHEGIWTLTQK